MTKQTHPTPPKVLTIDDESCIRDAFKNFLEDYDYTVLTAENGRIGINIFKKELPDLVLVDLRMPEMDGLEVLAKIKTLSPDTPVVVVSGTGMMADALEALRLGAWDFLQKPIADLSVLLHTVTRGIEHHRLIQERQLHRQYLEEEVSRRTKELERANTELQQINQRLRHIVETTKHISLLSRFDRFGSWLLEEFGRHMLATGGSLYLMEKDGLRLIHCLDPGHAAGFIPFPLPKNSLLHRALKEGKPILVKDQGTMQQFDPSGWPGYANDSILIFPLPDVEGKITGILSLHSKTPPPFVEQDRELGAILASYSSEALRAAHANEALKESQENLAITLDSIGEAVIATDSAGRITRLNPVAEKLTGWNASQAIGSPLSQVFHITDTQPPNSMESPLKSLLIAGKKTTLPKRTMLISKDNTQRKIAVNTSPMRDKQDDVIGVVLVFQDITEQQKLEDQLRQSRKMEAIGQLAGGVAHDFNNMLAGIIGAADILALKLKDNKNLKKYTAMIQDAGNRAAELTQKLLDFSRGTTADHCFVDMHRLADEACRILERSTDKRIRIRKNFTAACSAIFGDPAQIENTILNLGINARDAMPNGGTLTVSTSNVVLDQNYCNNAASPLKPGPYIEVKVADTGTGISRDIQEHIFEPFFTTKEPGKGTGLGLASVYSAVRNNQGDILLHSEVDIGTVFTIYLPVSQDAQIKRENLEKEEIVYGTGCILVVDDEAIIRNMTEAILTDLGYEVLLAADGVEAVKVYQAERSRIHLVLMDIVMPRMNGRDAYEAIKKIDPKVKVLMTSGFNSTPPLPDPKTTSLPDFIRKPFRRGEFSRRIHHILSA